MHRLAGSVVALVLAFSGVQPSAGQVEETEPLVYHQITALEDDTGGLGQPMLSADGTIATFAAAFTPETPTRIYTIRADGSAMTEVDAYQSNCACGAWVHISEDGSTVASSDSMQLRLVPRGGEPRTLVDLTSNELSSIRLTASGDRMVFLLARDTAPVGSSEPMQRGVYVVEAAGGPPRQIVGPDQVAALVGLPPSDINMLRLHMNAVDVSDDGARLVFGLYVGSVQAVFTVNADGSDLRQVLGPVEAVQRVAIAGDGSRVVMDVLPADPLADINEISIAAFGGAPEVLIAGAQSGFDEPLQLSRDGSRLLISPQSYLVDTASGEVRQLAVVTPGASTHTDLLIDGMPRATMNADATRFVYVIRSVRCADCANLQEQLATLAIGPADPGDAPTIAGATIDPVEIPLDYVSAATVSASIDPSGTLVAAGVVALRDGRYDVNVAREVRLFDDGQHGDSAAGDGTFTNDAVVHVGAQARDDDTGPRTIRFQAEIEASDGMRHAVAWDVGTLTVVRTTTS